MENAKSPRTAQVTSFMVIPIRVVSFEGVDWEDAKRTLSIMGHLNARFSRRCREQLKSPVSR